MSMTIRGYQAYLVRLWQSDTAEGPVWRASLESPHTGERQAFASLDALFAFLAEQTEGRLVDQPDPGPGGRSRLAGW
ncbi:MAG: hypothetical protein KKA73_22730 [Chloroflexi bacterium]|nr:hypothetical protein [Chloroflexota bacterium]MBU1750508.1 hypothetical protein [Chloroflexota bacterium]